MQAADRVTVYPAMREIEDRVGIEHIDELLARRKGFTDQMADLEARYGTYGLFDPLRKVELSIVKMQLRTEHTRDKVKFNETSLTDEAHAHPTYTEFCRGAAIDKAEHYRLTQEVAAIDATIRRANAMAHYCASEARL